MENEELNLGTPLSELLISESGSVIYLVSVPS